MHQYTLAFIIRGEEVLLLNRHKSPWMGAWNGVGGKINTNETPLMCMIREIKEETNILVDAKHVIPKGTVTWNTFNAKGHGLYVYVIYVNNDFTYETPRVVDEGILDWKPIKWACDMNNQGIARNIPYFLPTILNDKNSYEFACTFNGDILMKVDKINR